MNGSPQSAAGTDRPRPDNGPDRLVVEAMIAGLLLAFAVAFNLYHIYPEVAIKSPLLNDGVLHRLALERAVGALAARQNPTDPWLPSIAMGYPLFHHYQHLPYALPALLSFPLRGVVAPADMLSWISYLLLSLFPLSIYWALRRFGFGPLPAALAGLVASLLATDGLYGFDLGSYLWRGYGLYTQLWGMVLLPPALAQGYWTLKTGRGWFWAVLLLAATLLSHLLLGYMALLSLGLLALLVALGSVAEGRPARRIWRPPGRLALLMVLAFLVTAYFAVPFFRDRAFMNRSIWEDPGKYDAYGWQWTLEALVRGDLFDFGRFPSLTLLAGLGLIVCLWRWREARYRIPVVLALAWLLLYFGRPTWGALLDLLPLSGDLHLHRFIAGVHLGGIFLAGIALALPWEWALARPGGWHLVAPVLLTAGLLVPVYRERGAYLAENAQWMAAGEAALATEAGDLAKLVATIRRGPPGRVYAGPAGNWGRDYQIGDVPVYALLQAEGLDLLGYLYHALSLNADVQVLFDERRPEEYELFNVRYVVAPAGQALPDFVAPVARFGRHQLYQVATSGYFALVDSEVVLAGKPEAFYPAAAAWLASELPRAGRHPQVSLQGAPEGEGPAFPLPEAESEVFALLVPPGPPRRRLISESVGSNRYAAVVDVARDTYLLLKATYHPGWRATVDGQAAETVMLMPSYVGVVVAPGVHRVAFRYEPPVWRGWLALVGIGVLLVLGVVGWWLGR
jgi:hypothetical protein